MEEKKLDFFVVHFLQRILAYQEYLHCNFENFKQYFYITFCLLWSTLEVEIDRLDLSAQLPANEHMTNISLPTCNRDATNVKDVYNVYEIIPRSKLETLYDHAQEILNSSVEGYKY